jgi:hypothetical protein
LLVCFVCFLFVFVFFLVCLGQVYEGSNSQALLTGLSAFTEYEYRIEAFNALGSTVGPFGRGRTCGAAPAGLSSPVLGVLNATSMSVSWLAPTRANGIISSYALKVFFCFKNNKRKRRRRKKKRE